MKIHGMTEKYVLREAARAGADRHGVPRQKHPFMSPPATIQTDGRLFTFLQDTLRSAALDGPGIYDRAKVTSAARLDPVDGRRRPRPRRRAADVDDEPVPARGTAAMLALGRWRPTEVGHYSAVASGFSRTELTPRLSPRRAARDDTPRGARRAS